MNDPHVVALFYNVKHSAAVDYSDAKPLEHEEKDFKIKIENDKACFTMEAHYATEEEARKAVEEYIENWELTAGLRGGPRVFKLVYWKAEIEYRNVELGHHMVRPDPVFWQVTTSQPTITLTKSYPPPPQSRLKITPDVQSMYDRWAGYRLGKELLPSMAYFCLTILEALAKALAKEALANPKNGDRKKKKEKIDVREKAATYYQISQKVLDKIAELSTKKGGRAARKAEGRNTDDCNKDLKLEQARFLEEAVKAMILHMAAHEYDPDNMPSKIKLTDLPKLPKLPKC